MRKLLKLSNFTKVEDKSFLNNVSTQAKRLQMERLRAKKLKEKEAMVQIILQL